MTSRGRKTRRLDLASNSIPAASKSEIGVEDVEAIIVSDSATCFTGWVLYSSSRSSAPEAPPSTLQSRPSTSQSQPSTYGAVVTQPPESEAGPSQAPTDPPALEPWRQPCDTRFVFHPISGDFVESSIVAKQFRLIFQTRLDSPYDSWTTVSQPKYFCWDPQLNTEATDGFDANAIERYRQLMHNLRTASKKLEWILRTFMTDCGLSGMTRSIRPRVSRPQKMGSRDEATRVLEIIQWVLAHSLSGSFRGNATIIMYTVLFSASISCSGLTSLMRSFTKSFMFIDKGTRRRASSSMSELTSSGCLKEHKEHEHRTTGALMPTDHELMLEVNEGLNTYGFGKTETTHLRAQSQHATMGGRPFFGGYEEYMAAISHQVFNEMWSKSGDMSLRGGLVTRITSSMSGHSKTSIVWDLILRRCHFSSLLLNGECLIARSVRQATKAITMVRMRVPRMRRSLLLDGLV
ncbi:hypothetical protein M9H77_06764 [Catharanthus roseus]|uniref:Uncharacterized protein n=1 Tax=Catharanthus roseus TaxID=4058 RepID=A0ACC0BT11_CATRO|nr:hypothetical protein M9H77_06764 [Catharanthus roseus]